MEEEEGKEEEAGHLLPGACACEDEGNSSCCWKAVVACLVFELEGLGVPTRASTTTAGKCNITSNSMDTHLPRLAAGWALCVARIPVFTVWERERE